MQLQGNTSSGMNSNRKNFLPNLSQSAMTIDGARESFHEVGSLLPCSCPKGQLHVVSMQAPDQDK